MNTVGDFFLRFARPSFSPCLRDLGAVSAIPEEILASIGHGTSLRITQPLSSCLDLRGYCLGSALTLISSVLESSTPFEADKILEHYRRSMGKVIILQRLQESLAGIDCRIKRKELVIFENLITEKPTDAHKLSSKETKTLFTLTQEFFRDQRSESLRKYLIEQYEAREGPMATRPYALILEICGIYDKLHRPQAHRFHSLQRDILVELASFSGFQATEIVAEYGNEHTLAEKLLRTPIGIYYVSFSRHSFAVLREDDKYLWLWNSAKGFKRLSVTDGGKKLLAKSLRGCYTNETNWITISKCS